jgi:hypothetical protein
MPKMRCRICHIWTDDFAGKSETAQPSPVPFLARGSKSAREGQKIGWVEAMLPPAAHRGCCKPRLESVWRADFAPRLVKTSGVHSTFEAAPPMTAAQHSARIELLRSGLFHFMRASNDGRARRKSSCRRGENRRAGWGLSSSGCASGYFRGRRRANLVDSEKRHYGTRNGMEPGSTATCDNPPPTVAATYADVRR